MTKHEFRMNLSIMFCFRIPQKKDILNVHIMTKHEFKVKEYILEYKFSNVTNLVVNIVNYHHIKLLVYMNFAQNFAVR